jgi:hypothetical protein
MFILGGQSFFVVAGCHWIVLAVATSKQLMQTRHTLIQ